MSDLYDVPDGWEWKTINEVCTKVTDGAHKSPKTIDIGKPYITVRDVNNDGIINFNDCKFISDEDFDLLVKGNCKPNNGDVLFSKDGTVGKVALVNYDIEFVVLSSLAILKPSENILSNYLKNYLLSPYFLDKAIKSKTGAAIKRVVLKTIKELNIPLPTLSEQKRIVSKLDNLFEKIDKAIALHQKNIDEADVFMGSVLNDVFAELEEKYEKNVLKNISNIISGYAFKSGDFSNDNEVKSIKITNVGVKEFIEDDENKLSKNHLKKLSKYTVNYGDIVIALTRPYISNGLKVAFVPKSYNGAFINQRVAAIQQKDNVSLVDFIYYYLSTSTVLTNVMELSKTLNQPNLSIKQLSDFKVPLAPLDVQQKVVKYLDEVSEKIEKVKLVQKEKMNNLKALKASILDKAFRGEL